jgi:hypothetical protein
MKVEQDSQQKSKALARSMERSMRKAAQKTVPARSLPQNIERICQLLAEINRRHIEVSP